MLALPPPFVLQWERECTADALLSAAQPASEQCIGLMQCSCVLTHSTSPPPVSLLLPPLTVTIFSSPFFPSLPVSVSHVFGFSPSLFSTLSLRITLPVAIAPLSVAVRLHDTHLPPPLSQPIVKTECLPFQCIIQRREVRLFYSNSGVV